MYLRSMIHVKAWTLIHHLVRMDIIINIFVGALIGYITNFIAIKMIFRPYNSIYLLGYRLPFTPGLIHLRKKEIAEKVGDIVKDDLLKEDKLKVITQEKVEDYLTSKQIKDKSLIKFFSTIGNNLLDKFLKHLNIKQMVYQEITKLDTKQIENMVLKVSKKELKYIQYLGGIIGGTIGLLNHIIFK